MDQRRDFYLIFKEAINNLVKYSEATTAQVTVKAANKIIHLEIIDDGKGFDRATMVMGNGLQNMKQRADKWKSILRVRSAPGEGRGSCWK